VPLVDSNISLESRGVGARKSKPVIAKPAVSRDPEILPGVWELPARVARACNEREFPIDQQALAAKSGLTQPTISKLLHYRTLKKLPVDTVLRLGKALNVSIEYLTEDPTPVPFTATSRASGDGLTRGQRSAFQHESEKLSDRPLGSDPHGARK